MLPPRFRSLRPPPRRRRFAMPDGVDAPRAWARFARAAWLAAALATATARAAYGQPPDETTPGAPKPAVTMPVAKSNEGAAYPQQALDEGFYESVEVELVLTIDAGGTVTNVVLDKPVGHGFDQAAIAAARKGGFEP